MTFTTRTSHSSYVPSTLLYWGQVLVLYILQAWYLSVPRCFHTRANLGGHLLDMSMPSFSVPKRTEKSFIVITSQDVLCWFPIDVISSQPTPGRTPGGWSECGGLYFAVLWEAPLGGFRPMRVSVMFLLLGVLHGGARVQLIGRAAWKAVSSH